MAFSEEQLAQITLTKNDVVPPAPAPAVVPVVPAVLPVENKAPAAEAKVITLGDYIAAAPKEIQDVLQNSMSVYDEEKSRLIDGILLNKNHSFTKEQLSNRPIGELRNLARLAAVEVKPRVAAAPNYSGQQPVLETHAAAEEAMAVPSMSFAK